MEQSQGGERIQRGREQKQPREGDRDQRGQLGGVEEIRRKGREGWAMQKVRGPIKPWEGLLALGTKPFISGCTKELHSDCQGRKNP